MVAVYSDGDCQKFSNKMLALRPFADLCGYTLVPNTSVITSELIERFEQKVKRPVIPANQGSIGYALDLLDFKSISSDDGRLMGGLLQ